MGRPNNPVRVDKVAYQKRLQIRNDSAFECEAIPTRIFKPR